MTTDPTGLVIRSVDELGRVTTATNGAYGLPATVTHPEGNSETYVYDGRANVLQKTLNPKPGSSLSPIVVSATYPSTCASAATCNKPITTTDARGAVTSYTYDAETGMLLSKTLPADPSGVQPQTRYTYTQIPTYGYSAPGTWSQLGSVSKVTAVSECVSGVASACVGTANERLTTMAYADNNALLTSSTNAAGSGGWALNLTTWFVYNNRGDVQQINDPGGRPTFYSYDDKRQLVGVAHSDPANGWNDLDYTYTGYDANGRVVVRAKATGFSSGNAPTGYQYWFTGYTSTGKVASTTDPLGHVTSFGYDALDRATQVTDATGRVTTFTYDAAGQKLQERQAVGTSLEQAYATYTYTLNGKLESEVDALWTSANDPQHKIVYSYDGFDRPSRTTYADGTFEQQDYDASGNVVTLTTRRSLQIKSEYDALNRRTRQYGWNPAAGGFGFSTDWWTDIRDTHYSYDLLGEMLTANEDNTWNLAWSYDAAGRTVSHTQAWLGATSIAYDASGNAVAVTHPNGVVESFGFDAMNRLTSAQITGGGQVQLTYDTLSRRTGIAFGDGSTQTYTYDLADRLTSQGHTFPNTASANVTFTYSYDDAGRLTSKSSNNAQYQDAPAPTGTTYASANGLNQYPTVGGVENGYGANGSLLYVGTARQWFYYDEKNHLTEIYNAATGAFRADFYDGIGRRWLHERSTAYTGTQFTQYNEVVEGYDGVRPEVRFDIGYLVTQDPSVSGGWRVDTAGWRDYLVGPNPDERLAFRDTNGAIYYPHTDRQGTTINIANGSGQAILTRTYGPWGEPRQAMNILGPGASAYPFLYTGQHYDPTFGGPLSCAGLYHYKARSYDPCTGRFLQTDPIGTGDSSNLYTYAHSDPIGWSDPTGTEVDVFGRRFVTDFEKGNDAHRALEIFVGGLGAQWFSNKYRDPSGISFGGGRPDLGNSLDNVLWELKTFPDGLDGLDQVYDYALATDFKYRPAKKPPSFFSGRDFHLPGAFGLIDYHFWGDGVITYNYHPDYNVVFVPNIFPIIPPVGRWPRVIVEPIPVPALP